MTCSGGTVCNRLPLKICSLKVRADFRRSHCSAGLSSASLSTVTPGCRAPRNPALCGKRQHATAPPHLGVTGATGTGSEVPGSPPRDPCSTARRCASPAGLSAATSCPAPACGGARTLRRSHLFARVSAQGPIHHGSPPPGSTTARETPSPLPRAGASRPLKPAPA